MTIFVCQRAPRTVFCRDWQGLCLDLACWDLSYFQELTSKHWADTEGSESLRSSIPMCSSERDECPVTVSAAGEAPDVNLAGFSKHLPWVMSQASHSLCAGGYKSPLCWAPGNRLGVMISVTLTWEILWLWFREDWPRGLTGPSAQPRERDEKENDPNLIGEMKKGSPVGRGRYGRTWVFLSCLEMSSLIPLFSKPSLSTYYLHGSRIQTDEILKTRFEGGEVRWKMTIMVQSICAAENPWWETSK